MADYSEDYYGVLGVPPDANQEEIRDAWRRLITYWHPDRTNHRAAEDRAKELNRAYQVLSDPISRAEYDRWYQAQERIPDGRGRPGGRRPQDSPPQPPPGDPARGWWPSQAGGPDSGPQATDREPPPPEPRSGWRPPPPGYHHHPQVDPFTGLGKSERGSRRVTGYLVWMAGFVAWLGVVSVSIRVGGAVSNQAVEAVVLVVDVLCLWVWLYAIAAVVRLARSPGRTEQWGRFWIAELLGALAATSVTLLVASIAIAIAALANPGGPNAFRDRGWVGVALAVLACAGGLGALIFRFVWIRWQQIKEQVVA